MNIAMVTTWGVRCGIFTYSRNLANALAQHDVNTYIVKWPRFGWMTQEIVLQILQSIPLEKIDLIHIQHEYGIFKGLEGYFYNGLKSLGKPVITTAHATGIIPDLDKEIVKGSDTVIVHNKYMASRLDGPSTLIPHGCMPFVQCPPPVEARNAMGITVQTPIIGYLGFVGQQKGIETLIEAVEKISNVALMIAGGWHVEGETEYIRSLKERTLKTLEGRCQWHGYVSDEHLPIVYGAMDIVVYPPRSASESGALLMALSHGKAVVASNLKPFLEKQPYIRIFKKVDDLVEILKELVSIPEKKAYLEELAEAYVEENSWSNIAGLHRGLYQNIISHFGDEKPHAVN